VSCKAGGTPWPAEAHEARAELHERGMADDRLDQDEQEAARRKDRTARR
jgi:hypothetical protein